MDKRNSNQTPPEQETGRRSEYMGMLPECAPLANPYVPFQCSNPKQYSARRGLIRGTMFPGLDLPFMGMVNNQEKSDTPLHELQALQFGIQELVLFLDTHPDDAEVTELLQSYIELWKKGVAIYEEKCGPLLHSHAVRDGKFRWLQEPWPWEYCGNEEA